MKNIQNKSKYQEYNELWESMEAWSTSWEPRMPVWTLQSGGGNLEPHVLPYTAHKSFLWLSDTPLQAWHTHQVASTPGQWGRFPAVFCEYWDLHRNLPCLKYFLLDLRFGIRMKCYRVSKWLCHFGRFSYQTETFIILQYYGLQGHSKSMVKMNENLLLIEISVR